MKNMINKNRGITLIALVITIIVLLILAGITIASLTGENGLLGRAVSAKEETEKAEGKEEIYIAVLGSYQGDKKIDLSLLTENLSKIAGLTDKNGNQINRTNPVTTLPITVKRNNKYTYIITNDGSVENKKQVVLPEGLAIGSIVTYEQEGNTYKWQAEYCSYYLTIGSGDITLDSTEQGDFRITSWKVFKIDDNTGEVQLVPNSLPTGKVTLNGAPGYNNGVKLLNDACSALYSDISKGVTARSINMNDIESLLSTSKLSEAKVIYSHKNTQNYSHLNTDDQVSNAYTSDKSFPLIYEQETNSVINETKIYKGLDLSDTPSNFFGRTDETTLTNDETTSTNATSGYLNAKTSIQPYQTYYGGDVYGNLMHLNTKESYNNYGDEYSQMLDKSFWIASRCIETGPYGCNFLIRYLINGEFRQNDWLFSSDGFVSSRSKELFPVVTISSEFIEKNEEGFNVK